MDIVKRSQNRMLEMAKVIHNILTQNNIPYMIAYGTLLGAVRHQGFIPWDDDFDIYLFEDENNSYEGALEILKKELPKDMFLEYFNTEPKYFHAWAHIKDKNTICECKEYPQDSVYEHKGISIDLYKAVKMKESNITIYRNEENKKYLDRRKEFGFIDNEEYLKRINNMKNIINDDASEKEVYGLVGVIDRLFIEDIFPLKKYKYEDTEFYGPNNYDAILKKVYGKYQELPPIEKRKAHYSSIIFLND